MGKLLKFFTGLSTIIISYSFTAYSFNENKIAASNFSDLKKNGEGIFLSAETKPAGVNIINKFRTISNKKVYNINTIDFKSKLFTFTGKNLVINYETQTGGSIQFEIQNASGIAYSNYTLQNCPAISGNSFSYVVNWNSGNDLSSLVNIPVFLRIKMTNADLYSIQFKNQIANTDSTKNGFKIGTYKQFFPDTLLFANTLPALRKMHTPVKNPQPVISPVQPYEGTYIITTYSNVAYSMSINNNQMVYKMWLRSNGEYPSYFESSDGINWTRPNVEAYKFNGSMNNNIISDAPYPAGLYTVVDDSIRSTSDPSKRYKSVYTHHTTLTDCRLYVSFSKDGLLWIPYSGNPLIYTGEDLTSSGWNPVVGKYLGYFRDSIPVRKVSRYISNDWINWTRTGTVLKADAFDPPGTGFYNMQVLFKDSVYWGFASHLQLNAAGEENPSNPSRTDNTVYMELLFSRDGINFVRCGNRQPLINYGTLGSWDDQLAFSAGVPVVVGNEFYLYYNGFNFKHMSTPPAPYGGGPMKCQIGLTKIGLDRFVSLSAN